MAGGLINVKTDFGAKGDGVTDDSQAIQNAFDAAFGPPDALHLTEAAKNRPVYFPAGVYIAEGLLLTAEGAHIFGDASSATRLQSVHGKTVVRTNGFKFSHVENMSFSTDQHSPGAYGFDLDWDGVMHCSLNGNNFTNVAFSGEIGLIIGRSGYMGSETTLINCHATQCVSGFVIANYNALNQTFLGGGASECSLAGIRIIMGSIQFISNGSFANNALDIDIQTNCTNLITSCRTESKNFVYGGASSVNIIACSQSYLGASVFCENHGTTEISGCQSYTGRLKGEGRLRLGPNEWQSYQPKRAIIEVENHNGQCALRLPVLTVGGENCDNFETGEEVVISGAEGSIADTINGTHRVTKLDHNLILLDRTYERGCTYMPGSAGIKPSPLNYLMSFGGVIDPVLTRDPREDWTESRQLLLGQSGTLFSNDGATGPVVFTLPSVLSENVRAGHKYAFYVASPHPLIIRVFDDPAYPMTLRVGAYETDADGAGSIQSAEVGDMIELVLLDGWQGGRYASRWITKSVIGTWIE